MNDHPPLPLIEPGLLRGLPRREALEAEHAARISREGRDPYERVAGDHEPPPGPRAPRQALEEAARALEVARRKGL